MNAKKKGWMMLCMYWNLQLMDNIEMWSLLISLGDVLEQCLYELTVVLALLFFIIEHATCIINLESKGRWRKIWLECHKNIKFIWNYTIRFFKTLVYFHVNNHWILLKCRLRHRYNDKSTATRKMKPIQTKLRVTLLYIPWPHPILPYLRAHHHDLRQL